VLSGIPALLNRFREFCEIERHLPRLVHRHDVGVSGGVRSPAVEYVDLLPGGVRIPSLSGINEF
jgi:hypothetical protein